MDSEYCPGEVDGAEEDDDSIGCDDNPEGGIKDDGKVVLEGRKVNTVDGENLSFDCVFKARNLTNGDNSVDNGCYAESGHQGRNTSTFMTTYHLPYIHHFAFHMASLIRWAAIRVQSEDMNSTLPSAYA